MVPEGCSVYLQREQADDSKSLSLNEISSMILANQQFPSKFNTKFNRIYQKIMKTKSDLLLFSVLLCESEFTG